MSNMIELSEVKFMNKFAKISLHCYKLCEFINKIYSGLRDQLSRNNKPISLIPQLISFSGTVIMNIFYYMLVYI